MGHGATPKWRRAAAKGPKSHITRLLKCQYTPHHSTKSQYTNMCSGTRLACPSPQKLAHSRAEAGRAPPEPAEAPQGSYLRLRWRVRDDVERPTYCVLEPHLLGKSGSRSRCGTL